MFSTIEIKEFIVKLGRKWFFPDFSNRLTWLVVTLGAGFIAAQTPLKLIALNWLVETFNLNAGERLSLADIDTDNSGYLLGFGLIFIALIHNIFSRWIVYEEGRETRAGANRVVDVDISLFNDFIKTFPSGSASAHLLQTHDFENSFRLEALKNIDQFVNEWNCAEKTFINPDLESMRYDFWDICKKFSWLIAEKSSPTHTGFQSVVPDRYKGDMNYPDWIERDISAVNKMATDVFRMHQEFIKAARSKLRC